MTEQTMNAYQNGGHDVSDRPESPRTAMADSASTTGIEFADLDGPFKTILFVDNEPDVVRPYRELLETWGFSVPTADCGTKALSLLRLMPIDAVVLEYPLGGASGEIVRWIREAYGVIPTVLLSSSPAIPQSLMNMVDTSVDKVAGPLALLVALEELLRASE
jgi:DNA-binding response OmpR family regulator